MRPGARVAAAIEILDRALAGEPAERALTNWARASRFAGSGDRAAVRDLVYQALRCRRSHAWLGGAETGRGLMLGQLREAGQDLGALFSGEGHAPPPPEPHEAGRPLEEAPEAVRLDLPDWLLGQMRESLGEDLEPVALALRDRAPVFVRVNLARATVPEAIVALAADDIAARPHPLASTALEITANARRLRSAAAFLRGLVEPQDAASQAVIEALPDAARVLDYCAGGGGKALALAARGARVVAHDTDPGRMRDLPARADRAGARIEIAEPSALASISPFDLVLCDAPCSGSGAWRRAPEGKWMLTEARLEALRATQQDILRRAASLVAPGGALAYATCSLLDAENAGQVLRFAGEHPEFKLELQRRLTPLDGGDGFFVAVLRKAS